MGEVVLSLNRNPSAAVYDMTTYMALSLTIYPYPLHCIKRLADITIRRAYISALSRNSGFRDHADALYYEFMSDNLPTSESAS